MFRMKLFGAEGSYTGKVFSEKEMEDDLEEEEEDNNYVSPPLPQFNKISDKESDLHFIDTGSTEDLHTPSDQRRRLPPRLRKSSSPQENVSKMEVSNKVYPSVKNIEKECHPQQGEFNDYMFEPSRPIASSKDNFYHAAYKPIRGQEESASLMELKSPIVISEKDEKPTIIDKLSANLNSTLTFGNTKGLLSNLQLDGHHYKSQPAAQSYPINSSVYEREETMSSSVNEPKQTVHASHATNLKASSTSYLPSSSSPSETDILIHQFIKHEPPSSLAPNISYHETERPADIFSLNASQQYFSPNSLQEKESQSVLNFFNSMVQSQPISIDKNGQSSNSSVSNSPVQNDSPYGSLDKHNVMNPTGILHTQPQSVPFHPLGPPRNVQNQGMPIKLQEPQLASHLASHAPYPNYSQGFMTHAAHPGLHLNNAMPSISPYHLHNSNPMMPLPFSGLDLLNPLNQSPQTAQYYQQQLMQMQLYQQAQRAALNMNDTANSESLIKEQQPSVFGQSLPQVIKSTNQPTMNSTENQSNFLAQNLSPHNPQMINLQNQHLHLNQQTQPQVVPKPDISLTQQDGLPGQQPNPAEQGFQSVAPTNEEMIMQYHKMEQFMHQMRQPDIPLTQRDGLPGQYQQPNPAEQKFQPVSPTNEEMAVQYHKMEQFMRQLALGQSQAMPVPRPFLIPNHPMAMGLNSYYAPSLHAVPQSQPLPVHLVGNTGQLSPNQQDTYVASEMLSMIPDTNQTSLQPKIGRGRGRLN